MRTKTTVKQTAKRKARLTTMKTIGQFQFPTTLEEHRLWLQDTAWLAIHPHVLAAATTLAEGKWHAFIDTVPGEDYKSEHYAVLREGQKLEQDVAQALFPLFTGVPYYPRP